MSTSYLPAELLTCLAVNLLNCLPDICQLAQLSTCPFIYKPSCQPAQLFTYRPWAAFPGPETFLSGYTPRSCFGPSVLLSDCTSSLSVNLCLLLKKTTSPYAIPEEYVFPTIKIKGIFWYFQKLPENINILSGISWFWVTLPCTLPNFLILTLLRYGAQNIHTFTILMQTIFCTLKRQSRQITESWFFLKMVSNDWPYWGHTTMDFNKILSLPSILASLQSFKAPIWMFTSTPFLDGSHLFISWFYSSIYSPCSLAHQNMWSRPLTYKKMFCTVAVPILRFLLVVWLLCPVPHVNRRNSIGYGIIASFPLSAFQWEFASVEVIQ